MAAGLTIHPHNVPAFRARLNEIARHHLSPQELRPPLRLDDEVEASDLTLEQLDELSLLEPHGQANPPVQLVVRNLSLRRAPIRLGRERKHLKFRVTDGSTSIDALWWNGAAREWPKGRFDLACAPQINEFNGRTTVQLKVLDWRPAGAQ